MLCTSLLLVTSFAAFNPQGQGFPVVQRVECVQDAREYNTRNIQGNQALSLFNAQSGQRITGRKAAGFPDSAVRVARSYKGF